jgi:Flp pilus assembly protein TadD
MSMWKAIRGRLIGQPPMKGQETERPTDPREVEAERCIHEGLELLEEGRVEEALAVFHRAVQAGPQSARAHYARGLAYYTRGDYHWAIADLTQALRFKSSNG